MATKRPIADKSRSSTGWLGWLFALVGLAVLILAVFGRTDRTLLTIGLATAGILLLAAFVLELQMNQQALKAAKVSARDRVHERDEAVAKTGRDEAVLSSIADGVLGLDDGGNVMLFNQAASAIAGIKPAEVIGKPYGEVLRFMHEKTGHPHTGFIDKALRGEPSTANNVMLTTAHGKQIPIATSAAPIIDADGKHLGAIVTFRNVAHERELEQAKDEFVSLVSHQLRTPLTAMRLFVEMLLDDQVGELNPKQRDYLTKVELSTWRMIDLVNDFLNTSRIELDRLKVEPQELHLEDLVASLVEAIKPLAEQKNIALTYDEHKLPSVFAEPNLYGQIVNNLLTNAIRYTPSGGRVAVSLERTDKGYQLDVADTGIGIPKKAQAELFKRFYRADNAKRVESEGSGLGLYLVKRIADLCKGKVWFETAEGHGTTFHVIIPLSGMAASAVAESSPGKIHGR